MCDSVAYVKYLQNLDYYSLDIYTTYSRFLNRPITDYGQIKHSTACMWRYVGKLLFVLMRCHKWGDHQPGIQIYQGLDIQLHIA